MPTSTEKAYDLLEQLADLDDATLADTLPIPPSIARMALGAAAGQIPSDPSVLDDWALRGALWCLSFRSDDAAVFTITEEVPT
jgi:hypothetical protein